MALILWAEGHCPYDRWDDLFVGNPLGDRLEPATLAKAFRGELVPQNPDDEPASALLEPIRAEKAAQPQGKTVKSKQSPNRGV